jgi:hypothetical protein
MRIGRIAASASYSCAAALRPAHDVIVVAAVLLSGRLAMEQHPLRLEPDPRVRERPRTSGHMTGSIVLEPVPESWEWLDALAGNVDDDFAPAVREQPHATERPGLSRVFR